MLSKITSFALVMLILLAAALPVGAQDGRLPDDQQAMVDRVLAAITATETYTSFVSDLTETTANTMSIQMGGSASTAEDSYTVEQATHYTAGTDGQPNISTTATAQVSSLEFGAADPVQYTLQAEMRVVDGVLYVTAQREAAAEADLPAMPEGWVTVQDADAWPALRMLQLGDELLNLDSPDLFDQNVTLLLKEATSAAQTAGTLDDGTPVTVITLTLTGHDLRRGLGDYMAAKDPSASTAVYYGGIDRDKSSWTMTFSLNDQDQIVAFTADASIVWTAFDINTISPQTAKGTLLDQTTTLKGTYQINAINAPLEPVAAPEM
jgi:hypothetical protein